MIKKNRPTVMRKFNVKPTIMLIAAASATNNLEANLCKFTNYPHMTPEWICEMREGINRMNQKIGIKGNEQQRASTAAIHEIRDAAIETALTIKNQMQRGFINEKARLAELMSLLGYKNNWAKAERGNNTALLELLQTFHNHSDELRDELNDHNVANVLLDNMSEFTQDMIEANVTQETLKSASPVITAEMTTELNCIYDRVMDICSAGRIVFRKEPVMRALFSFSKLTSQQTKNTSQPAKDE